jgi:hypothetical protein
MAEKTPRSTIEKKKAAAAKKGTRTATTPTRRATRRTVTKQATPAAVVESAAAPAPAVKRKSTFRAGTWISILMLVALVELAFYLNTQKGKTGAEDATPTLETAYIFTEADGVVSSIEVKPLEGETVKIARNAENAWAVILPNQAEADQGLAEAAATQLTALPISSQIEDGKSPEIFGLDKPAYIITVEFKDGKKRTLEVGDTTPTNSGYYVRVDKAKMMITDLSGIDALLQLGSFPPYLNTPTPTALPPTETPIPTAEAAVTPTP